ncbi:hypothetical protein KSS87_021661 [Heliosperma pusillum]|nr:hypothetical protein KSS87_021661 [Heliosperma pusillum]
MFKSQSSTLTRSELKTVIEGDRVSSHVIHVWCEILNNNERLRSRDSPCRLFVSFLKDINLDNVDVARASLIFTPITVCSCPPFLFCFNLGNSKLQIIHPMKDTAVTYADYIQPTLGGELDRCSLPLTRTRSWEDQVRPVDNGIDFLSYIKTCSSAFVEPKLPVVTSVSWMMPECGYGVDGVDGSYRIALQSLRPRAFLMDQVIDMFGIKSTVGRTDFLYLPTTAYVIFITFLEAFIQYFPTTDLLCYG